MRRKDFDVYNSMKKLTILISMLIIAGCEMYHSTEEVAILLPESYPEFVNKLDYFWILYFCDENRQISQIKMESDTKFIRYFLDKGLIQPFSVTLVVKSINGNLFHFASAGFIYPYGSKYNRTNRFDWDSGFESDLLIKLAQYMDINRLNYTRLRDNINFVSEGNPRALEFNPILENLLSGNFIVYDIRKKRMRTIEVNLPEGIWYRENINDDPIVSISGNLIIEVDFYIGISRLLSTEGKVLEIDLKSDGTFEYLVY